MIQRSRTNKRRTSKQSTLQAPTGGLNARDPLADMPETDAVIMDNYFPQPSSVKGRKGSVDYVTGFGNSVETLAVYKNGIQSELYAFAGGNIYDSTTAGAVGAAVVSGLTNSRFQTINFGTAGGFFLLCVNGQNKMQVYNGTSWYADGTTTSVTGFDTADAINVNNFKNRVWFIEKESMNAWYLPVSSIGGAANSIDFSGLFKLGGHLVAMGNWTIDNAAGIDDYAVFITSEGEVALYKGTDPSSASTWALVGTFRMGRPLGNRCMVKTGADVLIITTDGAFPLSKALLTDRSQMNLAATDKISTLINTDTIAYLNNFGWQPIIFPTGNKLIINVPVLENNTSIQYVMNTQHGAWCRFTDWNASCFEVMDDKLFYGTNGTVVQADVGTDDNGAEIVGTIQQAYSYFGSRGLQKIFRMARPIFIGEGALAPNIKINVDYNNINSLPSQSTVSTAGAEWDTATWDTAEWVVGDVVTKNWASLAGIGISGGLFISTSVSGFAFEWVSTDVIYEVGGSL